MTELKDYLEKRLEEELNRAGFSGGEKMQVPLTYQYHEIPDGVFEFLRLIRESLDRMTDAINRLAATQEPQQFTTSKGAVTYTTAHYEDQPDSQTSELRKIARDRDGDS